jgi:hypothetical protein
MQQMGPCAVHVGPEGTLPGALLQRAASKYYPPNKATSPASHAKRPTAGLNGQYYECRQQYHYSTIYI